MKRLWSDAGGAGAGTSSSSSSRAVAARTEATDGRADAADGGGAQLAERRPIEFDGFARDLGGTVQDVLNIARPVAELGFSLAAAGTSVSFKGAASALRQARGSSQSRGLVRLASILRIGELATEGVHRVSHGVQQVARAATLGSLDGATRNLTAAGAENLAIPRLVLGAEETMACVAIARTVARLNDQVGLLGAALSPSRLAPAVLKLVQEAAMGTAGPAWASAALDMDLSHLALSMWLCAAVYGQLRCLPLGLFLECRGPGFLASAAESCRCSLLLDGTEVASPQMYRPAFAVFVDDVDEAVVVAIRGTAVLRDVLTDLLCEATTLEDGDLLVGDTSAVSVHTGVWRAARNLAAELEAPVCEALRERPRHRLVVTGHSLGGGAATLLCLLWRPLFGARVTCAAFGPAAVLDVNAAREAANHGVTSVVMGDDLVPFLSLRSATEFAGKVLPRLPGSPSTQAASAGGRGPPGEPGRRQEPPALCPAGLVLVLDEGRDAPCRGRAPRSRARVADQEAFTHLRVRPGMLSAHLPGTYLRALGQR